METNITFRNTALRLLMAFILSLFIIAPAFTAPITYEYYDDGQIKKVTYPDGYAITYTYDNSGNRLSTEITPPDTDPDAFAFTSISNVALNTLVESNAITITGINAPASISITSGQYAVSTDNGATWSPYSATTPSTISPNSMIKVRQISAATPVTTTVATLTIGGVSATFSVTTADTTPPISAILTPENNTGIMNTSFTIDGTASDIGSSVSKVEISINGGTWTQASGAINWTYQWNSITPGTYTLQSRATDSAGNIETPGAGITVHVYAATPSTVTINGPSLAINSQFFTIRGINYSPVPIAEDPYNPPYGDYFTSAYSSIHVRDLTQIRQMGANTIRLWVWDTEADHKDFLDQAYNSGVSPIYVIAGYNINAGYDLSNQTTRDMIKEDFRAMIQTHKNHPGILMWAIGNDLNSVNLYGSALTSLFSLINEMAAEAHELDPNHPVMMPLADENLIQTITAYNTSVPALDIWGANVYRGNSFGNLFTDYQAASDKPLLITGYGIDAYNDTAMTEDQTAQADHAAALWNEIVANSATAAGGIYTEYSDQWWAGMLSTDSGCPEPNNPSAHGDCGQPDTFMPDGYDNFEWWGVMRPMDNGTGPDTIEKRAVFTRLQSIWGSPTGVVTLNPWTNLYSGAPNNTSATNLPVGSFAVGGGLQRLLLVSVVMKITTNTNASISATYGGIPLTEIKVTNNSKKEIVWIGRLNDVDIGSGTKPLMITYNTSSTVSGLHVKWSSYTGVNQATPIVSYGGTNTASNSATFGSIISYVNNGMTTVVAGNNGSAASGTLNATPSPSFTADTATQSPEHTSQTFTTAKHTASGSYASSTAVSWTGGSGQSGLVVVSLQP